MFSLRAWGQGALGVLAIALVTVVLHADIAPRNLKECEERRAGDTCFTDDCLPGDCAEDTCYGRPDCNDCLWQRRDGEDESRDAAAARCADPCTRRPYPCVLCRARDQDAQVRAWQTDQWAHIRCYGRSDGGPCKTATCADGVCNAQAECVPPPPSQTRSAILVGVGTAAIAVAGAAALRRWRRKR